MSNSKYPTIDPKRDVAKEKTLQVQRTEMHSGPLPHPVVLAQYNEVVSGAAERILKMAENEQQHRLSCESHAEKNAVRMSYLGIIFAFLSVLVISGLVFYALICGFDKVAGAIAVGAIATVASVFVFFRKSRK